MGLTFPIVTKTLGPPENPSAFGLEPPLIGPRITTRGTIRDLGDLTKDPWDPDTRAVFTGGIGTWICRPFAQRSPIKGPKAVPENAGMRCLGDRVSRAFFFLAPIPDSKVSAGISFTSSRPGK